MPLKASKPGPSVSRVEPGSANKVSQSSIGNPNKFSLNLSNVRRVSGQSKNAPASGREKDSMDLAGLSGTLYSERRKNVNAPSSALTKIATRGTRYAQDKKPREDSLREDSNPSILAAAVKRKDVSAATGLKLKK